MALSLYHSRSASRNGLGALRDVSLKQARELATGWRTVLREGRDPIKRGRVFVIAYQSIFRINAIACFMKNI